MVRGTAATAWSTALVLACVPLLAGGCASTSHPPPAPPANRDEFRNAAREEDWLARVNVYRAAASLPPVTEDRVLSAGDRCHAAYIVKNEELRHGEDFWNRFYTSRGRAAAEQSNLFQSSDADDTDNWVIDAWMQSPFHAVGLLDPRLREVGYGSYREPGGAVETGAALNVIAGIRRAPAVYPVFWPGDGSTVPLDQHWGGFPSPLSSCADYAAPSGLPLILQLGPGDLVPTVAASSLTSDGRLLEHCVFTESSYRNPNQAQQHLGRSILAARDAVVLVPRVPLTPGATYTASISVGGRSYTWSFGVGSTAQARQALVSTVNPETGK